MLVHEEPDALVEVVPALRPVLVSLPGAGGGRLDPDAEMTHVPAAGPVNMVAASVPSAVVPVVVAPVGMDVAAVYHAPLPIGGTTSIRREKDMKVPRITP